jgi:predicted DNA-binding transcriptional regulator AlpA
LNDSFLKLKDVCRTTALSPATIYRMMAAGEFPRQIKIGAAGKNGAVVWSERAVQDWMGRAKRGATPRDFKSCVSAIRRVVNENWPQNKPRLFVIPNWLG